MRCGFYPAALPEPIRALVAQLPRLPHEEEVCMKSSL